MKKTLLSISAIALLAACTAPNVPVTVTGTVIDASMNSIFLQTAKGDSISLSTAEVEGLKGVLIADSVEIVYKDTLDYKKVQSIQVLKQSPYALILGSWGEPIPINAEQIQGFTLNQDGSVTMINMATLVFKTWSMPTINSIVMTGESIGNGQAIEINESYQIDKLDSTTLVLSQNGAVVFNLTHPKE